LLARLEDPTDQVAWERFDARYRGMLIGFARRLGLDLADAEEAAQRTLIAFCKAYREGKYDRDKGRFRHWLRGMARNEIARLYKEKARQPLPVSQRSSLEAVLQLVRDPEPLTAIWEEQWQAHIVRECLRRAAGHFSARDVEVFKRLMIEEQSVERITQAMDVSQHVVYHAKHRILAFMCSIQAELENVA